MQETEDCILSIRAALKRPSEDVPLMKIDKICKILAIMYSLAKKFYWLGVGVGAEQLFHVKASPVKMLVSVRLGHHVLPEFSQTCENFSLYQMLFIQEPSDNFIPVNSHP